MRRTPTIAPQLKDIRERLLRTPDTVCLDRARLVTEAYRQFADQPPPILQALALRHVLSNMTLDVESNPFFAGNTSSRPRAWMLVPEHGIGVPGQALVENPSLSDLFERFPVPTEIADFWCDRKVGGLAGIGHLAVDLEAVVRGGLQAVIDRAEAATAEGTPQQQSYRRAITIACRAVIDWAARYADAADAAADAQKDPLLRQAHLRVAGACRRVPAQPARDLFEAIQSVAMVHLALHVEGHGYSVSLGLLDRVLEPFAGEAQADPAGAAELIGAFLLKLTANSVFGSHSKTQAVTVGGADADGRDRCNAVTLATLDAFDLLRINDPHLFVRWHKGLPDALKKRSAAMLIGGISMPQLVSDDPTVAGMISLGASPQDAADYCVIGCNELGIPGRLCDSAVGPALNYVRLLRDVIVDTPPAELGSMQALLARLEDAVRRHLSETMSQNRQARGRCAEQTPYPLTTALMRGGVERGEDFQRSMPLSAPAVYERGLTNAVNALAAIEHEVFEPPAGGESPLTMPQLAQALRDNFADERLRRRLLRAPKWGNDDDRADHWMPVLTEMRRRALSAIETGPAARPHAAVHVIRSLHHVDGRQLGATPDGRQAGKPLADSVGPQIGTAMGGPAAALNSVVKLDAARYYPGGYNLNLTLSRKNTSAATILALVEAFFAQGGQELQINCFDAATLRDALAHPERHGDLVVRVAGFNALFVKLSRAQQDELLTRAEQANAGR